MTVMFTESAGTLPHFDVTTARQHRARTLTTSDEHSRYSFATAAIGSMVLVVSVAMPPEKSSKIFEPLIGLVKRDDLALVGWVTGPRIRSREVPAEFAEED